jgi:hypothetical protein
MRTALSGLGAISAAVIAGAVAGSCIAGSVSPVAGGIGGVGSAGSRAVAVVVGAIAVVAVTASAVVVPAGAVEVPLDVGVDLVRFPRPFAHVIAERFGLAGLLVSLLPQPGSFNLGLLCVRPGARRLRFAFPGIEFPVLGFPPDIRGLLALCVVPLLLQCLSAPPGCQQQQHDQHHHHYGH